MPTASGSRAGPRRTPLAVPPPRRFGPDKDAISEVIGTMLLVALTIAITSLFGTYMIAALPAPEEPVATDLRVELLQDTCPWQSGDEHIRITHLGGEALKQGTLIVRIAWNDQVERLEDEDLASGAVFTDKRFSIGERWHSPDLAIPADTLVIVDVQVRDGALVHTGYMRGDAGACEEGAA